MLLIILHLKIDRAILHRSLRFWVRKNPVKYLMNHNISNKCFVEIVYPELVQDTQKIFYDYIFPNAIPKKEILNTLRYLTVEELEDHNQIKILIKKYEFLGEHLLIFSMPPQLCTAIHTDGIIDNADNTHGLRGWRRNYSLNIPIKNCNELCKTEFFTVNEGSMFNDVPTNTTWLKAGESAKKIAEYCLKDNPILMNPQIPHKITNSSDNTRRISVSWTINPKWSWEQLILYFQNRLVS